MRVAAIQTDGRVGVEERDVPKIGPSNLLLQVRACGLCGTDILKVQKKSAPAGTVLGHEISGVVAETGSHVKKFKKGDRITLAHHVPCFQCHFCRHRNFSMCPHFRKTQLDPGGFAEYLRIPDEHVESTTWKIPDHLSFEQASFAEPISCCLRAVQRSELMPGDAVLIIGLGSIGLLLVQLFVSLQMQVFATDLVEARKTLAREFGATPFDPSTTEKFEGRGFDIVLLTAGDFTLPNKTLSWVRSGGKVHLFSALAGSNPAGAPLLPHLDFNEIYHRELQLLATYSSGPDDLKEALKLLAEGKIDVQKLITTRPPLEKIGEAVEMTISRQIIKAIITPACQ